LFFYCTARNGSSPFACLAGIVTQRFLRALRDSKIIPNIQNCSTLGKLVTLIDFSYESPYLAFQVDFFQFILQVHETLKKVKKHWKLFPFFSTHMFSRVFITPKCCVDKLRIVLYYWLIISENKKRQVLLLNFISEVLIWRKNCCKLLSKRAKSQSLH